jgi:hypothetical protein
MGNYEQWFSSASVNKEQCQCGQQLLANAVTTSSLLRWEGLANFKYYDDVHHRFIRE